MFYNANGELIAQVEAGALPDMITFNFDGTKALVANEGDARDYDGYSEEVRAEDLTLDTIKHFQKHSPKTRSDASRLPRPMTVVTWMAMATSTSSVAMVRARSLFGLMMCPATSARFGIAEMRQSV